MCVCTSIELRRLSTYHWHFFQCFLQKMVGWVALEVSLRFMLKFKPFEMWRAMSLFILLRFLLSVWKFIPYRKGMLIATSKKKNVYITIIHLKWSCPTSSPGRFSLALGAGPRPKAREKRPGDEVGRCLVVKIYRAAKLPGKYPPLAIDTEVNNCFSTY